MDQLELPPTSVREALESEIMLAGGWRLVAKALYPEKYKESPDSAIRFLRNQVNPEHHQKLDYYQAQLIKQLAREKAGRSALVEFDCSDLAYSKPSPIEPEDEKAKLQREYINSVKTLERLASQLGKFSQ